MSDKPQTYDSESYANRFLNKSIFQKDDRIFHQPGFAYDHVSRVTAATSNGNSVDLMLELESGTPAQLSLIAVTAHIVRLKFSRPETRFDDTSAMLTDTATRRHPIDVIETDNTIDITLGASRFHIQRDPFMLTVVRVDGSSVFALDDKKVAGKYIDAPLGLRIDRDGNSLPYLGWKMHNNEHFFGLGEKFNKVEKTSTRATIWACDTCGTNSNDMSYKSLPLLFSTRGWGLMLHSSWRSFWEIGSFNYIGGAVLTEDPKLDAFLFLGDSLKDLISHYTELTGRTTLPPDWALGLWMSRCMYEDRSQSDEVVTRMRDEKIPCDVIHLDPKWMKTHYYFKIGVDACDFERNEAGFPNLTGIFKEYADKGFSTCLWVNPYIPEDTSIYADAAAQDFLLKDATGGIARLEHGQPVGMVDFSNPDAKEWWKDKLKALLRDGAAVLKPDYGDRVPENAVFANGRTGQEMHNMYLYLFTETCYEAVQEVHGHGFVWRRAGYIGSQRYPGIWAGDTEVSWEGLRGAMRGGLSAGLSGEPFWSSDIGGFCGPKPDDELYIRWVQFGMLCPLARFHGTTPREPWHYGHNATTITRRYVELRYRLIPYLKEMGRIAEQTGLPLMRHMALEFPNEPNIHTIDDQYMLGDYILVAPVINPGQTERHVYLPDGAWYPFEDPTTAIEGGRFITAPAPLEEIPLFVRAGAEIPLYRTAPQHLKGNVHGELIHASYPPRTEQ